MPAVEAIDFSRLAGEQKIAVAVSGGSDSVSLLLLVWEWASLRGKSVLGLTFDHQLRNGSLAEAQWVANLCARLGIDHTILTWEGAKPGTGIQAKARTARYDAMAQFCRNRCINVLLTGHTLDDQAETVAMRQKRTQSPASLAGIWPEREWDGIQLVRPLLKLRRAALRGELESRGQDWLEDPSNENPAFERVRVRSQLREADIDAFGRIAETSQTATRSDGAEIDEWVARHAVFQLPGYFQVNQAAVSGVDSEKLGKYMFSVAYRLSGKRPKVLTAVRQLGEWLSKPGIGKRTWCGVVFAKQQRHVLVGREMGRIPEAAFLMPETGRTLWDARFAVRAPVGSSIIAAGRVSGRPRLRGVPGFVCDALPAVVLPCGAVHFPTGSGSATISAEVALVF